MHISLIWRPTRGLGKTPDEAALASRESPLPWNLLQALDATASQKAAHGILLRLFGLLGLVVCSRRSDSGVAWRNALGSLVGRCRSQWAAVSLAWYTTASPADRYSFT